MTSICARAHACVLLTVRTKGPLCCKHNKTWSQCASVVCNLTNLAGLVVSFFCFVSHFAPKKLNFFNMESYFERKQCNSNSVVLRQRRFGATFQHYLCLLVVAFVFVVVQHQPVWAFTISTSASDVNSAATAAAAAAASAGSSNNHRHHTTGTGHGNLNSNDIAATEQFYTLPHQAQQQQEDAQQLCKGQLVQLEGLIFYYWDLLGKQCVHVHKLSLDKRADCAIEADVFSKAILKVWQEALTTCPTYYRAQLIGMAPQQLRAAADSLYAALEQASSTTSVSGDGSSSQLQT